MKLRHKWRSNLLVLEFLPVDCIEKWMHLNILNTSLQISPSFGEIFFEKMSYEAFCFFVKILWKFKVDSNYFFVHFHRTVSLKRRLATNQFKKKDAKWPPICCLVVSFLYQYFWGNIIRCSTNCVGAFLNYFGKAEIRQLQVTISTDQKIFWFEVSINDEVVMKVLKCKNHLGWVKFCRRKRNVSHSDKMCE